MRGNHSKNLVLVVLTVVGLVGAVSDPAVFDALEGSMSATDTVSLYYAYGESGSSAPVLIPADSITAYTFADPTSIAVYHTGDGRTYAVVESVYDNSIQLLDFTDPNNIALAGSIAIDGPLAFADPASIAVYHTGDGRTYAAVLSWDIVHLLDLTDPDNIALADHIGIDDDTFAISIAVYHTGDGRTYAAVLSSSFAGGGIVHLLDLTDPDNIALAGSLAIDDTLAFADSASIAVYHTGDGRTYAAVLSLSRFAGGSIVHLLDLTDPNNIALAGSLDDDTLALHGATSIAVYHTGDGRTYAAVTLLSRFAGGSIVHLLDLTDPNNIALAGSLAIDDTLALHGATSIAVYHTGDGRTYAAVTEGRAVQLLDLTDPNKIAPAGSITDDDTLALHGTQSIAVYHTGDGRTYAAVASAFHGGIGGQQLLNSGIQLLDLTDPDSIVPVDRIYDDYDLALYYPTSISVYHTGDGRTYAAVSTENDIQLLDLTDPDKIAPAGSIAIDGPLAFLGAHSIAVYHTGDGRTYAAVSTENGIQLLDFTDPDKIALAGSIAIDGPLTGTGPGPASIAVYHTGDGRTYAAITLLPVAGGSIVQLLDLTDPDNITLADHIGITDDDTLALHGTQSIAVYHTGDGRTYAAITLLPVAGGSIVQLLDLTDTDSIALAGSLDYDTLALHGTLSITVYHTGDGRTYAAVTEGRAVHLLDLTDPDKIVPAGSITIDDTLAPRGTHPIAVYHTGDGRTYAAVSTENDIHLLDLTDPDNIAPVDRIYDDHVLALSNPTSITVYHTGDGRTYAAITSSDAHVVQLLQLTADTGDTGPGPVIVASVYDDRGGFDALGGAGAVKTAEISGRTYAIVAGRSDDGVQIIDISNPANPAPTASVFDNQGGFDALGRIGSIEIVTVSGNTYAVMASASRDGVQIMNITDPASPTPVNSAFHGQDGFHALFFPSDVGVAVISGDTYVLTGGTYGLQIVGLADPASPEPVAHKFTVQEHGPQLTKFNDVTGALLYPTSVDVAHISDRTYAVVASSQDAVYMIDITDPGRPTTMSRLLDNHDGAKLYGLTSVETVTISGRTYAVAVAAFDNTVQIIDITDPYKLKTVGSASDGERGFDSLDGALDVDTVSISGRTYAVVTGALDGGVQIIDITDTLSPKPAGSISVGKGGPGFYDGDMDVDTVSISGRTYAVVASYSDDAVHIIDITEPAAVSQEPPPFDPHAIRYIVGNSQWNTLGGAWAVDTVTISDDTYAVMASNRYFVIADITVPHSASVADDLRTYPATIEPLGIAADLASLWCPIGTTVEAKAGDVGKLTDSESLGEQIRGVADSTVTVIPALLPCEYYGAWDVEVLAHEEGTYVLSTNTWGGSVDMIDITKPSTPEFMYSISGGGGSGFEAIDGARGIDTIEVGGSTYALVAGSFAGGVQIIDITDRYFPEPVSAIFDGQDGFDALGGAWDVDAGFISGRPYAVVASVADEAVQIIDIADMGSPVPVSSLAAGGGLGISDPYAVKVVRSSGITYAVVVSGATGTVQILDITDPSSPVPLLDLAEHEAPGPTYPTVYQKRASPAELIKIIPKASDLIKQRVPKDVREQLDNAGEEIASLSGVGGFDTFSGIDWQYGVPRMSGIDVVESNGRTYVTVMHGPPGTVTAMDITDPDSLEIVQQEHLRDQAWDAAVTTISDRAYTVTLDSGWTIYVDPYVIPEGSTGGEERTAAQDGSASGGTAQAALSLEGAVSTSITLDSASTMRGFEATLSCGGNPADVTKMYVVVEDWQGHLADFAEFNITILDGRGDSTPDIRVGFEADGTLSGTAYPISLSGANMMVSGTLPDASAIHVLIDYNTVAGGSCQLN